VRNVIDVLKNAKHSDDTTPSGTKTTEVEKPSSGLPDRGVNSLDEQLDAALNALGKSKDSERR